MFNNCRGQIGETMTWVIATIVIIIILTVSVFIISSSPFKSMREFKEGGTSDLLVTKSFMGYLLTNNTYDELKDKKGYPDMDDLKPQDNYVKLANNIFLILYKEEYPGGFWMGVVEKSKGWNKSKEVGPGEFVINELGSRNDKTSVGSDGKLFYDRIKLNNENILELVLNKPTKS